jgi:7-cyano-7-deazaguanine reductase
MSGVLGQRVSAPASYAPNILEPIQRLGRSERAARGWDIWHAYELSWLIGDDPVHWVGWLAIPADSPATVESKSLKLYLNSLNHHAFANHAVAMDTIIRDISAQVGTGVQLNCLPVTALSSITEELVGVNLPACTIGAGAERIRTDTLMTHSPGKGNVVSEHLVSHSLRSLCPVTGQPDWGSLSIRYTGEAFDHRSIAAYLAGYRSHQGFHEQCVEQIFADLLLLNPSSLQVVAFYQRRGGIDITPWRSTEAVPVNPQRLGRQ